MKQVTEPMGACVELLHWAVIINYHYPVSHVHVSLLSHDIVASKAEMQEMK